MFKLLLVFALLANTHQIIFGLTVDLGEDYGANGRVDSPFKQKQFSAVKDLAVNWFQAQQLCATYGFVLVSLDTEEQAMQLQKYLNDYGYDYSHFWTSGSNLVDMGGWFWMSNGNQLTYTNWAPSRPNSTRTCLLLHRNQKWYDIDCFEKFYFVCEEP